MNLSTYGKGLLIVGKDTFIHKNKLKELKGTWNASLKGWIFPKTHLKDAEFMKFVDATIPLQCRKLDGVTDIPEIQPSSGSSSVSSSDKVKIDPSSVYPIKSPPQTSVDEKTLDLQIASLESTLQFLKSLRASLFQTSSSTISSSSSTSSVSLPEAELSRVNDSDTSDVEEERERDLIAQTGSLKLLRQTS